jgi:hypothetical protein
LAVQACVHVPTPEEQLRSFETRTGLHKIQLEDAQGFYLGKEHRGYQVLFRPEMGEVWGRYLARVAIGEVGRETGPLGRFITGSYEHVGTVVGSPADRLLSEIIGQPFSILVVLKHSKPNAPRLDVLSDFSTINPPDPVTRRDYVSFQTGSIYSDDIELAGRIAAKKDLIDLLKNFRSQYIRLDRDAVTFLFAGSENEYSGMIRNFDGSAETLVNGIMDALADIADEVR